MGLKHCKRILEPESKGVWKRCLGCDTNPFCKVLLPNNEDGRCQECKRQHEQTKNIRYKKVKDFYHSSKWNKCRNEFKEDNYFLCLLCASKGIIHNSEHVHHIKSVWTKEGYDKRFNEDNLMCLCEECHKKVHRDEVELLYGVDGTIESFVEDGTEFRLCSSLDEVYQIVMSKLEG